MSEFDQQAYEPESPTGEQQDAQQDPETQAGASSGDPEAADGAFIPKHRLDEVIAQRRQWEQSARQLWEQNQEYQRQLQQAQQSASQPKPDENAKRIREQLLDVMPELKGILDLAQNADQLRAAAQMAPNVQELQTQFFNNMGAQAMRTLNAAIDETFKGMKVPDATRRGFHVAFIDYLDQVPEAQQRYMQGDMSIAQEWWSAWQKGLLDPFRRGAAVNAQQVAGRVRRLPRPGAGTQSLGTGGPPKPKSEDELHEAAFEAWQQRVNQP